MSTAFAKIVGGKIVAYPYADEAWRRDYRVVSLPADPDDATLAQFGAARVRAVERPPAGEGKQVREGAPERVGDQWRQTWIVEAIPPDHPNVITERNIRQQLESNLDGLRPLRDTSTTLTTAQLSTAVRLLARVVIGLCRLALDRLDAAD